MGEAKRKMQARSVFGASNLNKRGIMMVPIFYDNQDSEKSTSSASYLSDEEVRFGLMFWDKIAWPTFKKLPRDDGHLKILVESGAIYRPEIDILIPRSTDELPTPGMSFAQSYFKAFQELEKYDPGRWSLSTNANADIQNFLTSMELPNRGITTTLHQAVPVPRKDASFEDILEFKTKRSSELLALRAAIDKCSSTISTSPDFPSALAAQLDEIDTACSDLLKLFSEKKIPSMLSSMEFSFEITGLDITKGILAAHALSTFNLPTVQALTAGVTTAFSSLKVKSTYGLKQKLIRNSPYRYAYYLQDEITWV